MKIVRIVATVIDHGTPNVADMVLDGKVTINEAFGGAKVTISQNGYTATATMPDPIGRQMRWDIKREAENKALSVLKGR